MTQSRWSGDDELLADLQEALAPIGRDGDAARDAGRAAFAWRTVDAELAALSRDSLLREEKATVRSTTVAPRSLTFESASLTVELDVEARRILGQLVPPQSGDVVVLGLDGEVARARADDTGCFTVDVPADAKVRLRCSTGTATVVTDWVRV